MEKSENDLLKTYAFLFGCITQMIKEQNENERKRIKVFGDYLVKTMLGGEYMNYKIKNRMHTVTIREAKLAFYIDAFDVPVFINIHNYGAYTVQERRK